MSEAAELEESVPATLVLSQLADIVADRKVALEAASDAEHAARELYEEAEIKLFDAMEAAGAKAVRTARGMFSRNELAWASIENPEAARAWAQAEMPEIITLNNARLSKIVRDRLKEGEPLPEGVTFNTSRKITWRRS